MKTIGVYTKNFSLYYDILKILRRKKIPYVSLTSLKNIPSKISVIITSNNEIHDVKSSKVIAADAYDTVEHAIDLAFQILIGKDLYHVLYIGIDPGDRPGIAVIGDDLLLCKTKVNSPDQVYDKINRFLKEYPANQAIIRIGHGSIIIRNRIINSLIPLKTPIEIVDETKTTPSNQVKRHLRDSEAAAAIALIHGGKVQSKLPLEPTKGEIKKIQEKSRKKSNGNITISKNSAKKVLEGKISIEEAIKIEKKKVKF